MLLDDAILDRTSPHVKRTGKDRLSSPPTPQIRIPKDDESWTMLVPRIRSPESRRLAVQIVQTSMRTPGKTAANISSKRDVKCRRQIWSGLKQSQVTAWTKSSNIRIFNGYIDIDIHSVATKV